MFTNTGRTYLGILKTSRTCLVKRQCSHRPTTLRQVDLYSCLSISPPSLLSPSSPSSPSFHHQHHFYALRILLCPFESPFLITSTPPNPFFSNDFERRPFMKYSSIQVRAKSMSACLLNSFDPFHVYKEFRVKDSSVYTIDLGCVNMHLLPATFFV